VIQVFANRLRHLATVFARVLSGLLIAVFVFYIMLDVPIIRAILEEEHGREMMRRAFLPYMLDALPVCLIAAAVSSLFSVFGRER
jgi:membrane-anchored glycerophosphoryl diester phosphodiesterase (GDPDase)